METQITTPNGNTLFFHQIEKPEHYGMPGIPNGIIIDPHSFFALDFEIHQYDTHTILFREFHIDSTDTLTAQFERAALNLMLRYCLFELTYEDGIPCLSHKINL